MSQWKVAGTISSSVSADIDSMKAVLNSFLVGKSIYDKPLDFPRITLAYRSESVLNFGVRFNNQADADAYYTQIKATFLDPASSALGVMAIGDSIMAPELIKGQVHIHLCTHDDQNNTPCVPTLTDVR